MNVTFKNHNQPDSLEPRIPTVDRFREEATMTIAHSVMSLSFGRKGSRHSAAESTRASAEAATRPLPDGMICTPWEGLYLPAAEADTSEEVIVPSPELERFLTSLFSGE
jgi:hypothetical protein